MEKAETEQQTDGQSRAVAYLRVSTKDQATRGGEAEGFSIPAQREACKRKAASLGAAVVDEFADRGESARKADRPQLQALLAYIRETPIDYVIVHKIDRLARNRADDVEITLAIKTAGAALISCSENIDETPSGLLLHGIMSSIAEFYSRNLANEITKGLVQKAKTGGTPGKAPLGYRNVRHVESGREVRTVEVDPERAPLVRWAFMAYASGEWRLQALCEELNRRGLDVPATRSKPVTPLHVSRLHWLLKSPYYKGVVSYRGVDYRGSHEALVSVDVWQRVQDVLTAHNRAGEKQRRHNHYLKSSLYCGHCGSRMIITHSRSQTGRVYGYYTCIGKHQKRTGCTMRAIAIERAEELVEEHYATVRIPTEIRSILEPTLRQELLSYYSQTRTLRTQSEKRRSRLVEERAKLLEAHYAEAIPLDLLRSEQQRISRELDNIAAKLAQTEDHQITVETNLRRALDLAEDCQAAYLGAPPSIRRRLNQVFFDKLFIEDEDTINSAPAAPFDTLLARSSAIEDETASPNWADLEAALNDRDPEAWSSGVAGVKEPKLVAGAGFEPATSGL